ncbi:MAG: tRNA preQ1(34) S-adenosylmethionine ribosyltransferase-isomerase QueA [Patescibacteria group bacterium]
MLLKDFDYTLPQSLIAQTPTNPRDHSRLFVYDRSTDTISHKSFFDIESYLSQGDVIVLNNTKVFPARLKGKKQTGGNVEVFLLQEKKPGIWQVMVGGAKRHEGDVIDFAEEFFCTLIKREGDGETWVAEFDNKDVFWQHVEQYGQVPLPPYITDTSGEDKYQTVFAKENGSVAAPTAGLHFTDNLLDRLRDKGVIITEVTLHVGLGTFAPVTTDKITEHKMHAEWGVVSQDTADLVNTAKKKGNKTIAVGTTSIRTLETFTEKDDLIAQSGWIDTFIYPGYEYKIVDGIITNFHLPKSTLLMLVAAFLAQTKTPEVGVEILHKLYKEAIDEQYRFYSFGDAMLLL